MRKSRTKRCKKLRLKHIPDFFDDVEEIVYTYRESLHGDISVEYIYCLTFNDGNPLATFEGTRPMDNPDFEKRVYDQVCQQKVSVSVNAWYGLLYRLFIDERVHLWDDTKRLDIDEPDTFCDDSGFKWILGIKTKKETSGRYFNFQGWWTYLGYIEYRADTENSLAVNTFKSLFKSIADKMEEAGLTWVDKEPAPRMAILYRDDEMIIGQREFRYEIVE